MSRVCVVLVNWNGWRDTVECLESLLQLRYPDFRVVVVDNASGDDSLEHLARWAEGGGIPCARYSGTEAAAGGDVSADSLLTLVANDANLGFAGGNNVALRYALARGTFEYCWLLNNDTVVEPDALEHLVRRMRREPEVGICGSTIRFYERRDRIQALGGGYYCRWIGLPWHHGRFGRRGTPTDPDRAEARLNYVEGASMLVSRRFLDQVGLLCEDYFLYFEEADWALRGKGRFRLGFAPQSVVYHKVGSSIGTSSNPARKSRVCDFYNIRNRIRFARRHHPVTLPSIYLVLCAEVLLRALCGRWDLAAMAAGLMLRGGEGELPP